MLCILFTTFYLLTAVGFTVIGHYCGSKLSNISISLPISKTNCCGDATKAMGCCSDKEYHVQIESDQKSNLLIQFPQIKIQLVKVGNFQPLQFNASNTGKFNDQLICSSPPFEHSILLYNQIFRI